jgi:hypothetical protein
MIRHPSLVMAGLDPAIHVFVSADLKGVDPSRLWPLARHRAGHDESTEIVR